MPQKDSIVRERERERGEHTKQKNGVVIKRLKGILKIRGLS
jgi:hypothetical protein